MRNDAKPRPLLLPRCFHERKRPRVDEVRQVTFLFQFLCLAAGKIRMHGRILVAERGWIVHIPLLKSVLRVSFAAQSPNTEITAGVSVAREYVAQEDFSVETPRRRG